MTPEPLSPDEQPVAYKARFAMFQVDTLSSEVNERFSQLLLGFAAAGVAFFAEKIFGAKADALLGVAATLLCLSLLAGAGQLLLAHIAAMIRSGFGNPNVLAKELEPLEPKAQLRLIREVLVETLASRFWPDSILLKRALAAPDLLEGIGDVIRSLRRMIQWQALLYRLQLLLSALAAIPVVVAIFR
jgi:hypothetical protein